MKGSFVNRNGHYYAVLEDKDSSGKRKQKWVTLKGNYKQAVKEFTRIIHEKNNGTYVEPTKTTVKEYLESWLQDIIYPNLSPRSYEAYELNVNKYIIPAFGNIPITSLKSQQIQKLLSEQQKLNHHRTAQYIFNTLNKSFNSAVKMGIVARNPCDGVESPKVPKHEMKVMDETDLHIFLEYARKGQYFPLFYTFLFSGMRRSELLAIQWKDVDLVRCQISVNRTVHFMRYGKYKGQVIFKQPKTANSRRLIELPPSCALVLSEHYEAQKQLRKSLNLPELTDEDLVFEDLTRFAAQANKEKKEEILKNETNLKPKITKLEGKDLCYQPDSISHAWMKLAKRSGLSGIRLHDSRHTVATLMLKMGVHPKVVQQMLGHANISTTINTYSHVLPGLQRAAADKFDAFVTGKENNNINALSTVRR